jgi:hypothetical protein
MAKWDYTAVHGINKYLWSKLQSELGWAAGDYGNLVPVTTPAQQPEFNSIGKPYIVYGYSPQGSGEDWLYEREVISYAVFSSDASDIRQVINLMKALFNRFDESAKDVNKHIATYGSTDNKTFDYKSIRLTVATGPQPPLQEGGRMDGSVVLAVSFTHHDSLGRHISNPSFAL